jgi:GNAT superfamily N-acetyltransferase
MTEIELISYDATVARGLLNKTSEVHQEIYSEPFFDGNPFFSQSAFQDRFLMALEQPGFAMTFARLGAFDIGCVYGYTLTAKLRWWDRVRWVEPAPPISQDLAEDGARTLVIPEIMVRSPHRRKGVARLLHDDLLSRRNEGRAGLRVLPNNVPARTAYRKWGWSLVGRVRPVPEAPVYECMVKLLRPSDDPLVSRSGHSKCPPGQGGTELAAAE